MFHTLQRADPRTLNNCPFHKPGANDFISWPQVDETSGCRCKAALPTPRAKKLRGLNALKNKLFPPPWLLTASSQANQEDDALGWGEGEGRRKGGKELTFFPW